MNILLFEKEELKGSLIALRDERAQYLTSVQGVVLGQQLRVGQLASAAQGGLIGRAEVVSLAEGVALRLGDLQPDEFTPWLSLLVALPRPQSLKKVLLTAAMLGAREVVLCGAEHVEPSYFQSSVLRPANLRQHLLAGLSQAVATYLPQVRVFKRLEEAVASLEGAAGTLPAGRSLCLGRSQSRLEACAPGGEGGAPGEEGCAPGGEASAANDRSLKICAEPEADTAIEQAAKNAGGNWQEATLAVGPATGWSQREQEFFREHGFSLCHSGQRVLRVEQAVGVFFAQLELLKRLQSRGA